MPESLLSAPTSVIEHPRFIPGSAENVDTVTRFASGLQELQAENSEIVGATLFGSRLKGEARANSDVDCNVLIDASALSARGIEIDVDATGKLNWGGYQELQRDLQAHIGDVLAAKTDKDPVTIRRGIYIKPISAKLIEKQIELHVGYLKQYEEYMAKSEAWIDNLDADINERPEPPDYIPLSGGVPALFSPELAPGLDIYRSLVVDKLAEEGEYGKKAWEDILSHVEFGEGHLEVADPSYYPVDLKAAQEQYGSNYAVRQP